MALPNRQQAIYWGVGALFFFIMLWALGNVILPFLVGGAIAYFLDPIADRLERLGCSRALATSLISIGVLLSVVLLMLSIIPTLVSQLTALINSAPEIFTRLQTFLMERFPELQDETSTMRQTLQQIGTTIQERGGELANIVFGSALSVISAVVFMVVVPVVAFYLLLDWDKMVARVDSWLPLDHAPTIRELARQIDRVLAGFVRGQMTVCLILGTFYAVALMLAGLDFGMIVGAIAGAITFIPYIGSLVGGTLAIGLALFQFWGDWFQIALIAGIFGLGQFLEGNIITPRLVGNSVGLHPVWLLFALSAFGSIFGFVGMLVAVPIAASIGVVARFAIAQYKASPLYQGAETPPELDEKQGVSRQLAFDLDAGPSLRREDFVLSPATALALAALDGWRDWPQGRMLLTGPAGAGKTHLAHIHAAATGAVLVEAAALPQADIPALADQGAAVVENAEAVAGDPAAEEALFHLHNLLGQQGGTLLVTAAAPPRDWGLRLPDLASRMQALAVTRLAPPDDALLAAVLGKLFADRQIAVPDTLIPYLILRMDRSFDAARRLVAGIDARALAEGRPVGRALAAEVLDSFGE